METKLSYSNMMLLSPPKQDADADAMAEDDEDVDEEEELSGGHGVGGQTVVKYPSELAIMETFYVHRRALYAKRKANNLSIMGHENTRLTNQMRFITEVQYPHRGAATVAAQRTQ